MKRVLQGLILVLLTSLSFSIIYYLYGLPMEAIAYSFVLCAFLTIVVLLLYSLHYYKSYFQIRKINQGTEELYLLSKSLPAPLDELETQYQDLVLNLMTSHQKCITDGDLKLSELTDYYTLWVHQVKTPISALGLLFQTEPDTEKSRGMKLELFKIEQYVEMALHIMRIESATSDWRLSPCSLESLCGGAVKKYRSLFIEKKIKLNFEVQPITVVSDEKWATVVLEQLISNGLKYTPNGEIRIYNKANSPHILYIEDTGIGIHAEDLPRIFEKGFTGYNGRLDKRATGIGLYLTKQICEKLGLTIQITSQVDQGTQVQLTFIPYSHVSLEMKM